MQILDLMPKQGHAATAPIIASVAVFKLKNAPQAESTVIVTSRTQQTANHSLVKKLQPLFFTRRLRRSHTDFSRFERIEPEPDEAGHEKDENGFVNWHGVEVYCQPCSVTATLITPAITPTYSNT